jgi:DNA-binding SARP family transcriptional activator/predicted ATPase
MADLILSLLGPVRCTLDGRPVRFRTKKSEAMLLYLASEGVVRRESLLGLLWQDYPERSARQSLRTNLSYLKRAIPEVEKKGEDFYVPLVLSDSQAVQINPAAAYQCDLATFSRLLQRVDDHAHNDLPHCDSCLDNLRQAVELYRGDFIADFYLPDSNQFEDWTASRREEYRRRALLAMESLGANHLANGQYELAEGYARRQLEHDNLRESAHRQLMSALARSGRRRAALAHYETCRQLLQDELGIEPSAETLLLYEAIMAGDLEKGEGTQGRKDESAPALTRSPPGTRVRLPPFLDASPMAAEAERDVFVARDRELAQLDAHLESALAGQGRVVFISGEAGQGKTALLRQFTHRAQRAQAELIVAGGNCNAYAGVGDPYFPFRRVMSMLNGDVEARWAAGTITREQAIRLWRVSALTAQSILQEGPDLIDVFVSGGGVVARAEMSNAIGAEWLDQLKELVRTRQGTSTDLEQIFLFEQFTNVLVSLAAQHPLLITLDDLQWADAASISLLFHLGRRLRGRQILIVGAYRPDEVALGLDGERHPLEKLLSEFKRAFGDIWVELAQAEAVEGQAFVNLLLDAEPNRLGEAFRQALFRKTGGHPLFTIELLRAMQARGDLERNEQGYWIGDSSLDWQRLPARIEGVFEERLGRLGRDLQDILTVASVEGETFTAEIVAQVHGLEQRQFLRQLSLELDRRHHIVRETEQETGGRRALSRYQFRHILFQRYLYDSLSAGERRLLHGDIGRALEALHEGQTAEIANQLAHHFLKAGEREKSIAYSLKAAQRAKDVYAFDEAVQHLQTALNLLDTGETVSERLEVLEELGDVHGLLRNDAQAISLYQAALELCSGLEDAEEVTAVRLHRKILQTIWSMQWYIQFEKFEAMSETRVASRAFLESRLDLLERQALRLESVRVFTSLANDAGIHSSAASDKAKRYAQAAVDLAEAFDAPLELSAALQVLASVYYAGGDLRKHLGAMRRAHSLTSEPRFADTRGRINILINFSEALGQVGDYGSAILYAEEAERLAVRIGAVDRHVQALNILAQSLLRLDRWDELRLVDDRRRDLEQRYSAEQIGASCLAIAFAAAASALQGDMARARALREKAYAIMVRVAGGSPENWGRSQHY